MQYFSIKDVENLCGIKAHTLRIWEQRYSLFVPKRKGSSHRIYDNEDLKRLLQIAFLYHNGWKISKIAKLTTQGIEQEVRQTEVSQGNYPQYISRLLEAALDFNELLFVQIMDRVIEMTGFEKCILDVCYPFLQKVGMLWLTNRVIPAQEHFSSYIIQNRIISETEKLPAANGTPRLLLFSPSGEQHEMPLLFIHYLLKKNGWSVVYLGPNIGKEVLQQFVSLREIRYLFLHLISNLTGQDANDYFEDLCRSFPDKTIIVSGAIVQQIQRNFVNLKVLRKDREIYDFIEAREKTSNRQ